MDHRQKFLKLMNFETIDRMPAVHFGYWDELIGEWAEQGFISKELADAHRHGNEADRELDKTALRKDKAAVDEEIKRIQKLVDLGGFLPCPDHRLMPGTKFELVQYYTEQVKNLHPFEA